MNSNNDSGSKLSQYIKAPIRVLCKARDLYVKSMNGYAGRMRCGGTTLPRSFSVNPSRVNEDEDLRALMRAVSQRRQEEEVVTVALEAERSKGLPKSFSVGIWRIDEDKPCYFQADLKENSDVLMYPRSRSYAVNKRTGMVG